LMTKDFLATRPSRYTRLFRIAGACLMAMAIGCAAGLPAVVLYQPGDVIPCTDPALCPRAHPAGPCPWCGLCVWQNNQCNFRGRRNIATCPCYEGQTQACTKPGGGSGTWQCVVTNATTASWGACN
jgi:hypothetical protein